MNRILNSWRRFYVFGLILPFFPVIASAQVNLVPNPGFEEYINLPCSWLSGGPEKNVKHWERPTTGTPDILSDLVEKTCYANCRSQSESRLGSEAPHSGHVMAMIAVYGEGSCTFPNYREYLSIKLKQPLVAGKKYYAEMYISLADHAGYATNNIGMYFYNGKNSMNTDCVFSANPQVNTTKVIDVAKGWVKISGTFVAEKSYSWMAIGNFFDGANTEAVERPDSVLNPHYKYWTNQSAQYYIDDILVREASHLAVTGDTLVPVGQTAMLKATGCRKYSWADTTKPGTILGYGDKYSAVDMKTRRTFYVYSDCDTTLITVNVIQPGPPPEDVKTLNGRKVRTQRTVYLQSTELTISLYDKDKVDGDIVSLYLGDSCLVSNYSLTKKKKTITVHIDRFHPQQLILHAENQGTIPPNTATVTISDGKTTTTIVLRSDFGTSDSVVLVYRPSD
jgi:hypothetical protein